MNQTEIASPTFEPAVREESQKVWQACFSRRKSVLLAVAMDSLRFVLCGGADHTNL